MKFVCFVFIFLIEKITAFPFESEIFSVPSYDPRLVEAYSFNDHTDFLFVFDRVSWGEANVICRSKAGKLAVLDTNTKAEFIAYALSESSAKDFEDLYIGGIYNMTEEQWFWLVPGGENIHIKSWFRYKQYPRDKYPYWVEEPIADFNNVSSHCMAVDRRGHNAPLFVNLPCAIARPFICEFDNVTAGMRKPVASLPPLEIGNKTYHLYGARYTWEQAVAHCAENDKLIATLTDMEETQMIAQRMRRSRPIIEMAWLSGYYDGEDWTWITTHNHIPSKPDNSSGNASDFPPWYREPLKAGCLLLDRHLCDQPVFLAAKCSRKRSFVCEDPPLFTPAKDDSIQMIPTTRYQISTDQRSWLDAMNSCQLRKGTLATFHESIDELENVLDVMSRLMIQEAAAPVRHIWLGGRLIKNRWKWVESWPNKFYEGDIDTETSYFGSTRFCDRRGMEDRPDMPCLNLDRDNHKALMLYGLSCNYTQYYICVIEEREYEDESE